MGPPWASLILTLLSLAVASSTHTQTDVSVLNAGSEWFRSLAPSRQQLVRAVAVKLLGEIQQAGHSNADRAQQARLGEREMFEALSDFVRRKADFLEKGNDIESVLRGEYSTKKSSALAAWPVADRTSEDARWNERQIADPSPTKMKRNRHNDDELIGEFGHSDARKKELIGISKRVRAQLTIAQQFRCWFCMKNLNICDPIMACYYPVNNVSGR